MGALKGYLDRTGMSVQGFSRLVRSSEQAVYMWLRGERIPRDVFMRRIISATKGEVTPNDFHPIKQLKIKVNKEI